MLVLSRKPGESIIIGEDADITITVLKVNGKQVEIGIDAPRAVPVHREVIYKRLKTEKNVKSFASR